MNRFTQLYEFVSTYLNLTEHQDYGRLTRDLYEDGQGMVVTVELWDRRPAVIVREGLDPLFEGEDGNA